MHLKASRTSPRLHLIASVALAAIATLIARPAHAQFFALGKGTYPLEFYEIDYSALASSEHRVSLLDEIHYLPITPDVYLSLGGELREQYWHQVDESHALRTPIDNNYTLQRLAADAALHWGSHLTLFAELARADQFDKLKASTTDETRGRLQQGFIDLKEILGPVDVTARLGRQEITLGSGRFVWINDSSNVRTTHDGARLHLDIEHTASIDLIATEPVTSTYAAFDDWSSHAGRFLAFYASEPLLGPSIALDEYFYQRHAPASQFASLTGNDDRNTAGGRIWGEVATFKYDIDIAYQWGTFEVAPEPKSISALGASSRILYGFEDAPLRPAAQLQASYFSGTNDPQGHTLGTFSAPFPRPTMLNYAGLETLENLIEAYPAVLIEPMQRLFLRFGPEVLWRASTSDAVYVSRTTPLSKTLKNSARYIGTNFVTTAQWALTPHLTLFAEYLHELPGGAITLAGGHAAHVGIIQLDFNF